MSPGGWIGIGMGYLQTGPFLDHLAVIKMNRISLFPKEFKILISPNDFRILVSPKLFWDFSFPNYFRISI